MYVEGGALSDPVFPEFARDYVLLAHITTRIPGRANDDLLHEKGGLGWPTVLFLDAEGDVVTPVEVIYYAAGGPSEAIRELSRVGEIARRYAALKAEGTALDARERVEWLHVRMALRKLALEDARREAEALPFDAEDRARMDQALTDLEFMEISRPPTGATVPREETGRRLYALFMSGRRPSRDPEKWSLLLWMRDAAEAAGDAGALEAALAEAQDLLAQSAWVRAAAASRDPRGGEQALANIRVCINRVKAKAAAAAARASRSPAAPQSR